MLVRFDTKRSNFAGCDAQNNVSSLLQPNSRDSVDYSQALTTHTAQLRCRLTLKNTADTKKTWYYIVFNGQVSLYFTSIGILCNTLGSTTTVRTGCHPCCPEPWCIPAAASRTQRNIPLSLYSTHASLWDPFSLLTNSRCSVSADKLIPIIFKSSGAAAAAGHLYSALCFLHWTLFIQSAPCRPPSTLEYFF